MIHFNISVNEPYFSINNDNIHPLFFKLLCSDFTPPSVFMLTLSSVSHKFYYTVTLFKAILTFSYISLLLVFSFPIPLPSFPVPHLYLSHISFPHSLSPVVIWPFYRLILYWFFFSYFSFSFSCSFILSLCFFFLPHLHSLQC